jgi:Ulp1 family protease
VKVPLQNGPNDCGFYLLHFAEQFIQDPDQLREIIRVSIITKYPIINKSIDYFTLCSPKKNKDLVASWGDLAQQRRKFHDLVEDLAKTSSVTPAV